jgi:ferredoxin
LAQVTYGPGRSRYPIPMAYVITEPCIGVKDRSCVDVCPVDCIHGNESDPMLYIDPEVCIDCGACVSACPVEAIYADADVPDKWQSYIQINADYFKKEDIVK